MKEIKAIVQPFMLPRIVEALQEIPDLPGVTVSEVRGFGRGRAANALEKVSEGSVEYVKKAKLEIVVPDELVALVVRTIQERAHTGSPGDGKIFVYTVEDVVRIRTGERGENAI
ncbi:MAG: P-II family nitrogen regulator [Terriglobales bacterium]